MPNQFKPYEHKAAYYETDCMGIVHHSNYIRWFEEARVDFMEQMGYSYQQAEKNGVMIPVLSAQCDYKLAAVFSDVVLIIPKIEYFNGFKMTITYKAVRKSDGALLANGETKHCFTDLKLSPIRTKRDYTEIYELFKSCEGVDLI
ncbi:MAG: acyl-CoA thioesterase [Oscillospiraceae bacterium]|nr:acyl-CoA thioesterase [Oscillospiraceae bacterium]